MIRLNQTLCFLTFLLVIFNTAIGQNYVQIEGTISDTKTHKPMSYASVGIQNHHIGTITNKEGNFKLFIPDSLLNDTLRVNYLGYQSFTKPVKDVANKKLKIKLSPSITEISEVIVKPLSPIEVLHRVKENHIQNLPEASFITKGYYLQEITENDRHVEFIEAFIDLFNPVHDDTTESHARLIEGRTMDNLSDIQFMKRFFEKKSNKKQKKAMRKGEPVDTTVAKGLNVAFGGPKSFISSDYIRNFKDLIPEKDEKKFRYSFAASTTLDDRKLYVIQVQSKGSYNHARINGKLYIDKKSYALVKMQINYEPLIPIIAKPFLKIHRIKVNEIALQSNIEYKLVNNHWYPNKHIVSGSFDLQKKYSGHYIECSIGSIRKAFVTTNIEKTDISPFAMDDRLTDEPLNTQLGTYHPEFWQNRNIISY